MMKVMEEVTNMVMICMAMTITGVLIMELTCMQMISILKKLINKLILTINLKIKIWVKLFQQKKRRTSRIFQICQTLKIKRSLKRQPNPLPIRKLSFKSHKHQKLLQLKRTYLQTQLINSILTLKSKELCNKETKSK